MFVLKPISATVDIECNNRPTVHVLAISESNFLFLRTRPWYGFNKFTLLDISSLQFNSTVHQRFRFRFLAPLLERHLLLAAALQASSQLIAVPREPMQIVV